MEHAAAVRAIQERTRKEREERREKEARAEAARQWELDKEARAKREMEERETLWEEEVLKAVGASDQEAALAQLAELTDRVKDPVPWLRRHVAPGGGVLLHSAVSRNLTEVVAELLRLDPEAVRQRDDAGQTPLHWAATSDSDGALVRQLAAYCSADDLARPDGQGRTPHDLASRWALPEVAQTLVDLWRAHEKAQKEQAAAAAAAKALKEKDVCELGVGHLAALAAVREGRWDDALALIQLIQWVFVNVKDDHKRTLLHNAASRGRPELCEAVLEREDFNVAEDVDKDEATALHIAASGEKADCCRAICLAADCRFDAVNAMDKRRQTALHLAALRGNQDCFEAILLHPDADPYLPDWDGKTALEYALERGIDVPLPATATDEVDM